MYPQRNRLDFTGENVYVGFDVHKKNWRISILTDNLFHKTFSQDRSILRQEIQRRARSRRRRETA